MGNVVDNICKISNTTIALVTLLLIVLGGMWGLSSRLTTIENNQELMTQLLIEHNKTQVEIVKDLKFRISRLEEKVFNLKN